MANTIITPTIIAKEALMQLRNNLVMGNLVHREYKKEFVKKGATVNIRKPVKFTVTDGAALSVQNVTESNTSITIDKQKHVDWEFDTIDLTLTIEEYSDRYIKPAAIALANIVDNDLCGLYLDVPAAVGTAGTTPNTFKSLTDVGKKMAKLAIPVQGRKVVLNPDANYDLADGMKGFFEPVITKDILKEAALGRKAQFDIFMGQNIKTHTSGSDLGTPLVDGASQTGSSITTDGWTVSETGVLLKGDVITLAGVNSVNPVFPFDDTGDLMQFVVTADVNSDGSGDATIPIYPPITATTAYQTVTGSPADNAAIVPLVDHAANLAFVKQAFALVMIPKVVPDGVAFGHSMNYENISIRVLKVYDHDTDREVIRMDILYGVKTIYPELGCRLLG